MSEERQDSGQRQTLPPHGRNFNPLVTYVIYLALVLVGYVLFWTFHYPALIAFTMMFVVIVIRDTVHIVRTYEIPFARKAAVVNLVYSLTFFIILVVNGISLTQGQPPIIWPEHGELAAWSPMFVLGGVFGIANIKRMYGPERTSFSYP